MGASVERRWEKKKMAIKADNLILDGRNLLFRASDAFRTLTTEIGGREIGCGGMYGFLSVAVRLHRRYGGRCWVAWEGKKEDNFRLDIFPAYKKKKKCITEEEIEFITDMMEQEKRLMVMLRAMGVRQYMGVHCEADDVMAWIAENAHQRGESTIIYTGDSDLRQLVKGGTTRNGIAVVSPGLKSVDVVYDTSKSVKEKHGVYPAFLADLKALAGDSSDSIPGVRGIGQKTAATLIEHFGDVKKVILAAASTSEEDWPVAERFRKALIENRRDILLYKKLTVIKPDVEVQEIARKRDQDVLRKHFHVYRFRSLLSHNELIDLMKMGKE